MPQEYPVLVLAPVLAMMLNVLTHVVVSRLNRGRNQIKYMFYGFLSGLTGIFFLVFAVLPAAGNGPDLAGCVSADLISYASLAYGYFHFVNINMASLRIRVLQEIIDAPDGLSEKDVLSRYNSKHIIDTRVKRLIGSGQLTEKDGYYYPGKNRTFLMLFWLFEILKHIVLGHGNRFLETAGRRTGTP